VANYFIWNKPFVQTASFHNGVAPAVVDAVKPQYVKLDMWPDCRIEKWLTDPAELPHPRYKDIPGFHPLCAVVRPNTGGKLTFKIYVAGVKRRPIIISGDWKDASFDTVRDVLGTRLHVKAAAERMGHVEYKQPFSLFDVKRGAGGRKGRKSKKGRKAKSEL